MEKRLPKWTVRMARLYAFSVTWIAGIAAALSPAAQRAAEAQVIPTAEGAGTTVTETSSQFDIAGGTQAGGNLFHEFDEFSINESQTANFTSDSGVFNIVGQVSSANPSYIDGTVQVTGSDANLYLVNPSGVLFGPDAQVSLSGSFAATTADQLEFDGAVLNVLDNGTDYSSFTGGPSAFHFTETSASAVVNQGDVTVAPGESISLIGGNVVNTGTLSAPGGEIGLVAVGGENTVRYGIPGSLLSLEVTEDAVPTGTDFAVTDLPDLLTGSSTPLVDKLTLQPDGSYELGSLQIGDKEVSVAGEISTRATVGDGGEIALLGRSVDAFEAVIDASGNNGGNIRIGRDVGSGTLPTSVLVWLHDTSVVRADGLQGAGGDIAVGSTRRARVQGDISAQGTTLGGLVETSSSSLNLSNLRVDASGPVEGGRWLAAANDIDIVSDALTFNQLAPSLIEATLDSGTNIEITTTESGGTGDILLSESITQNGGGNANLTLTGRRFINNNGSTIDLSSTGQLTFGIDQVNAEATPDSSSIERAIAAIGNVNGDRLIDLGGGLYDFSGALDVKTQVEIQGAGVDGTRLQDTSGDRVFNILAGGDLGLRNLGLTKSPTGPDLGGGITNNGGALTITNAVLFNNVAENGGAIEVSNGGTLSIDSSILHQNTAVGSGGGIQLQSGSSATVVDTVLAGNLAGEHGGGIDATSQVALVLDGVTVVSNSAASQGGGVSAQAATVGITDSSFLNNSAADGGGLRARENSTVMVDGGSFTNNNAVDGEGGAIALDSSDVTLQSVEIFDNTATTQGGGVAQRAGTLVINASDLRRNEANGDGGAIAIAEAATTRLAGSTLLIDNAAVGNGGGLATTGTGTLEIEAAFWSGNQAGGSGGGLYKASSGSLAIESMGLQGNTAGIDGGALSLYGEGAATINNVTINENEAQGNGGGLHLTDSGRVTLTNAAVLDNVAGNDGGGLYQSGSSELVGSTANLIDNRAGNNGGAIASNTTDGRLVWNSANIIGNAAVNNGGAIVAGGETTVDLSGLLFRSNESEMGDGGALAVGEDASLSVLNVSFDTNRAAAQGGAIYTDSTGPVDITSGIFQNNEAADDGGAIAHNATDQTLTLRNATFSENVSQADGGAVFAGSGTTTLVNDSQFIANRAEGSGSRGGGLAIVNGGHVVLTDTVVANNETTNRGGGLYVDEDGTVTVTGTLTTDADGVATSATTRFVDNQAGRDGGGILAWDEAVLDLNGVLFRGNFSGDDGGGVAVTELSRATITDSNFENNTVAENGGGLYSNGLSNNTLSGSPSDHRIVLKNSRFIDNEAGEFGGGLYHGRTGSAVVRESLFRGNESVDDGGGVHVTSGTLTLENSQLLANQAHFGGGLAVDAGGDVIVTDTAFTENVAAVIGGGAAIDLSSQLQVSGSTFEGNEATSGAGLFNLGKADIVNATFSSNVAQDNGGAIYSSSSDATLTVQNTTLTANEAGAIGGGIADNNSQLIQLQNTIVASNTSSVAADVSGSFVDKGNNLIGSGEGATGFTSSVLVGSAANPINPGLTALANNGGPTKTHAPFGNSVAVDAGTDVNVPAVDQRGVVRFSGSAVDIGSVELSDAELLNTSPVLDPPEPTVLTPDLLDPTVSPPAFSELDTLLAVRKRYDLDDADTAIRLLEQSFSQSFEDYWDLSAGPDLTFSEVQAILRRAQDEYKVNSAVVYAIFSPETPANTESDTILQVDSAAADDDLLNLSVVMPAGELVSYQLPVTRKEVVRQVRYLRSTVSDPEDERGYRPLSQQLYQWLLAPLEEDLAAQNVQNLMYALDAGLRSAPITAMQDYEGFSLERYGLSVVPSMGLMQADFPVSVRRSTVAMGVSEFISESPLPAVPIELQVVDQFVPVSQTVLNESTTLDAIKSVQALEQPGVLHLATHASFDRRSPEDSYIHLWNESLNMQEFSELDWEKSDLELLILSACSTALGSHNSELGFAGLAAASGVDATVGSLWDVSDVGTLALMSEFYAQLEKTDLRFEALRQAQLALLNGETRIEGGNLITGHGEVELPEEWNLPDSATLDHPFFWSAFTMVGNPW